MGLNTIITTKQPPRFAVPTEEWPFSPKRRNFDLVYCHFVCQVEVYRLSKQAFHLLSIFGAEIFGRGQTGTAEKRGKELGTKRSR
ncbi:hypothetical protein BUE80_DR007968 [Diplocarpon rosae]|nr:hypothetical protein BUE80_DR007968 [Diplocarpon rosae]